MNQFQLKAPEEILRIVIEQWKGDRDKIASLSILASEGAEQSDPICQTIFQEAAGELFQIVSAISKQGNFPHPIPVSYSGGVFRSGDLILNPFASCLGSQFHLAKPILGPLAGGIAKCLMINQEPITDQIIDHLKEAEQAAHT